MDQRTAFGPALSLTYGGGEHQFSDSVFFSCTMRSVSSENGVKENVKRVTSAKLTQLTAACPFLILPALITQVIIPIIYISEGLMIKYSLHHHTCKTIAGRSCYFNSANAMFSKSYVKML